MTNRNQVVVGAVLVVLGVLFLAGRLLHVDLGQFCWPVGLMALGAAVLLRPRMLPAGTEHTLLPFGDVRRKGNWQVRNEEIWLFAGNVRLDLRDAEIPEGETTIRLLGFVGDVDVVAPPSVAMRVTATAFLDDLKAPGRKESLFLTTTQWANQAYEEERSARSVHLQITAFVVDLSVSEA